MRLSNVTSIEEARQARTPDPFAPVQLGNLWLLAATIARNLIEAEGNAPFLLTLGADGQLEAVGPMSPQYDKLILSRSYVCSISRDMPIERLAGRLRQAFAEQARREIRPV